MPRAASGDERALGDRQGLDADVLGGPVAPVGGLALDLVDDVHALGDLTEDGVLAVEPRRCAVVTMKNCEPLVFGPALAMASAPRTILCSLNSSSNL